MRQLMVLMVFVPVLLLSACSSNSKVVTPDTPQIASDQSMQDWGDYGLKFDPSTKDVSILYGRDVAVHYEITSFLNPPACGGSGCISASLVSWDPATNIAAFDVTIKNFSNLTPSDVRMIFYWLGSKEIVNVDSYTKSFVGTVQPFIAFGKLNANRIFPGGTSITETVKIYWPPASPFSIYFKVSAWLWLNCQDPYEINGMYQLGVLKPAGGSSTIGCQVLDWQNNVTQVVVDSNPVTGGSVALTHTGGSSWEKTIANSMGAPVGVYKCLITAVSPNAQNFNLYNYILIQVSPNYWTPTLEWQLPQNSCKSDFGIISYGNGIVPPGSAIVTYPNIQAACNQIVIFPGGWTNPPYIYATVENLDPGIPQFQPWPVVRLDAADDGAFGWTNENPTRWLVNPNILNWNTYCNMDNQPKFIFNPEMDDHRHYMLWQNEIQLRPADTCDTFNLDQCVLYIENQYNLVGFQGFQGAPQYDYTDNDATWAGFFPPAFIGREAGQVDPTDIISIDCMRGPEPNEMFVYVAQQNKARIEVYAVVDIGPGNFDNVFHINTIWVQHPFNNGGAPIDIELLPASPAYQPDPGSPLLCVLIDNSLPPVPPPGWGGSVWIYDAYSGVIVDQIGDSGLPAVFNPPTYLDTDDNQYAIHVMQVGPVVKQFNYF